jgi:hypothetical protein
MVARGHDRPAGRAACLARAVGRGPHHAATGAKAGAASCAGVAGREIMRRSRAGWGGGRRGGSRWRDFHGGTNGATRCAGAWRAEGKRAGIRSVNWQNRAPNHCVDAYVKDLRNNVFINTSLKCLN